jgi:hypothetical protein
MSVVAGKINLSKEMENKMEKLEVKNINSIWQLISALENKEGIASEQPWVFLASLLYQNTSKKTLAQLVNTINGMENK